MKITFKFIALAICLIFGLHTAEAQRGGGGREFDPEKRAEQQTTMMADSLGLSSKQTEKVKEINLKYAQKMKEARSQNTEGDWEAMRAMMTMLRQDQDKELATVLTIEQVEKWSKIQENQRAQRGGPNGKGKGDKDKNKDKDKSSKSDQKG